MGNVETQEKLDPQQKEINSEKLNFLENTTLQGVGNVNIYRRGQSDNLTVSTPLYQDIKYQDPRMIEQRLRITHPHLLSTLGVDQQNTPNQQQPNLNNSRFFFEYFTTTLESIVSERLGSNRLFPEEDLIALLKGVLSALAFLQEKGVTHGDIHPSTIYFDNNSGIFKINDRELLAGKGAGYAQALQKVKFSFLSPELVQSMREQQYEINSEVFYISDVFALGMCLLEAASLKRSCECYDQNYTILAHVINDRMQFIQQFYQPDFCNALALMLEYDPRNRLDCLQLWTQLYGEKIQQSLPPQPLPQPQPHSQPQQQILKQYPPQQQQQQITQPQIQQVPQVQLQHPQQVQYQGQQCLMQNQYPAAGRVVSSKGINLSKNNQPQEIQPQVAKQQNLQQQNQVQPQYLQAPNTQIQQQYPQQFAAQQGWQQPNQQQQEQILPSEYPQQQQVQPSQKQQLQQYNQVFIPSQQQYPQQQIPQQLPFNQIQTQQCPTQGQVDYPPTQYDKIAGSPQKVIYVTENQPLQLQKQTQLQVPQQQLYSQQPQFVYQNQEQQIYQQPQQVVPEQYNGGRQFVQKQNILYEQQQQQQMISSQREDEAAEYQITDAADYDQQQYYENEQQQIQQQQVQQYIYYQDGTGVQQEVSQQQLQQQLNGKTIVKVKEKVVYVPPNAPQQQQQVLQPQQQQQVQPPQQQIPTNVQQQQQHVQQKPQQQQIYEQVIPQPQQQQIPQQAITRYIITTPNGEQIQQVQQIQVYPEQIQNVNSQSQIQQQQQQQYQVNPLSQQALQQQQQLLQQQQQQIQTFHQQQAQQIQKQQWQKNISRDASPLNPNKANIIRKDEMNKSVVVEKLKNQNAQNQQDFVSPIKTVTYDNSQNVLSENNVGQQQTGNNNTLQSETKNNIQILKQEIQKSKKLIESYQKQYKPDGTPSNVQYSIQNRENQLEGGQDLKQLNQNGNTINLDERIKQVIARSQAIRENFH